MPRYLGTRKVTYNVVVDAPDEESMESFMEAMPTADLKHDDLGDVNTFQQADDIPDQEVDFDIIPLARRVLSVGE